MLQELTERSQDLQTDALRDARAVRADLADLRADRGDARPEPQQLQAYDVSRRGLLQRLGLTGGGFAARGFAATGIGAALVSILGRPAAADQALDVQILNTASSLENLAVATYEAALGLPFIKNGNKTIVAFAQTTMKQHAEHGSAFNGQAKALGGKEQTQPNAKFLKVVEDAKPKLKSPLDVVQLAAALEEVASDTYLNNLTQFADAKAKGLMGSVMGVEVQHLATLKAVEALLMGGGESLIKIPTDLAELPAAAGSVGFKDGAFLKPTAETIATPDTGAVK
ncbi:MAG: ferritin-like domain-containing protein [Actinobacteria bacterium]|nr:ferritin-like domain-containing protein [Actinomycetota bacterium]MBW3651110.1 ferritin-like domain-containing protein [Actinomycetota bacterium]